LNIIENVKLLVADVLTPDAGSRGTFYGVGTTALMHVFLSYWLVDLGVKLNMDPFIAALIAVVIWGVIWEGIQWLRFRHLAKRVRGLWDWFGDFSCYLFGAIVRVTVSGPWGWVAASILGVLIVGYNAVSFGFPKAKRGVVIGEAIIGQSVITNRKN
jgi:hypothetical protein